MKEKILKIGVIILLVIMLFVLTGCGENKTDDDSKKDSAQNTEISREEIYNEAKNEVQKDEEELDITEIKAFNEKFEEYEGKQTGTDLKVLFAQIISNNSNENKIIVEYEGKELSTTQELSSTRAKISNTKSYNVSFEYEDKLIKKIIIK